MPDVLLVHGAWHGAWAWEAFEPELAARGLTSRALELPLTSVEADAAVLRSALVDADTPVTVVAHSYGGVVASLAAHPAAALVLVAALAVDAGESSSGLARDLPPAPLTAALQRSADGSSLTVDPDQAADVFYADVEPSLALRCVRRLRPLATACLTTRLPGEPAWRSVPTTYVVCADDRAVPVELQRRLAARIGGATVELPGSHSPMLARPDALADVVARAR